MTGKERDVMTLHVATIFAVLGKKAFLPSLYLESGKIFAILRSAEASSYGSYFIEMFDQSKGIILLVTQHSKSSGEAKSHGVQSLPSCLRFRHSLESEQQHEASMDVVLLCCVKDTRQHFSRQQNRKWHLNIVKEQFMHFEGE